MMTLLLGLALATPLTSWGWPGGGHFGGGGFGGFHGGWGHPGAFHPGWGGHVPIHPIHGPGFYYPGLHYPWHPGFPWVRPVVSPIIWTPGLAWGGWGTWKWSEWHRVENLDVRAYELNSFIQPLPQVPLSVKESFGLFDNAVQSFKGCLRGTPAVGTHAGTCINFKDEIYRSWGIAQNEFNQYMASGPAVDPVLAQKLNEYYVATQQAVDQLGGFWN